jgi:hypothetical protein
MPGLITRGLGSDTVDSRRYLSSIVTRYRIAPESGREGITGYAYETDKSRNRGIVLGIFKVPNDPGSSSRVK